MARPSRLPILLFTTLLAFSPGALSISGGTEAKPGQFPSTVLLILNGTEMGLGEMVWCGGTLIRPQVVLTAGHCTDDITSMGGSSFVLAGTVSLKNTSAIRRNAVGLITHPLYNKTSPFLEDGSPNPGPALMNYDVGIVVLDAPIEGLPLQQLPAANWTEEELAAGEQLLAMGWGKTPTARNTTNLLWTALDFVPRPDCEEYMNYYNQELAEVTLCAASYSTRSTCSADSGGPLLLPAAGGSGSGAGSSVQVGITSFKPWGDPEAFSPTCGQPGQVGGYTSVAAVLDWVEATIEQEGL